MDYNELRHLADSWGLALLVVAFLGFALWPFRPGSSERYREAARLPLNDDDGSKK